MGGGEKNPYNVQRFQTSGRTLRQKIIRLPHPGILQVFHYFCELGPPCKDFFFLF